jgi:large subunit ribosomal protein L25
MITLSAKIRKESGKEVQALRDKGLVPAVLYGQKTENQQLTVNLKDFENVYREAGMSSLISLEADKNKYLVLIHEMQTDPITLKPLHVDFFQPSLTEVIAAKVPIIFDGEAPAAKDLGGTFVKNISEIEVHALPQALPHEIRVDISVLKTFEDSIMVKNIILPADVKVQKGQDDIIAFVAAPQKVEEELEKPIEEKVEEVGKVETEKKEEEPAEGAQESQKGAK